MVISWPVYNGKPAGTVLRSTAWEASPGIIADQTRSGKYMTRINHVRTPDIFNVVMHMTLPQYRAFDQWWKYTCRKGVYTFWYPKINDNTGVLAEYQFDPFSKPAVQNTSGDNLEVSMVWMEAA